MNSIGKDCNELKKAYEECFNSWFSDKFLKGVRHDHCDSLFNVYRECVRKAVVDNKIDLWEVDKNILATDAEKKPLENKSKSKTPRDYHQGSSSK